MEKAGYMDENGRKTTLLAGAGTWSGTYALNGSLSCLPGEKDQSFPTVYTEYSYAQG